MQLVLIRKWFEGGSTIGELFVDGQKECYTLEDEVRETGVKIPARTAIPAGMYQVDITESQRFKRRLPIILNVPDFVGIRIHSGNTTEDTEGCVLVGRVRAREAIYESRMALDALLPKLESALAAGQTIMIAIINDIK